jgi:2,3-dihydroxyphenylpropionate 1,2-dioxygenase
MHDGSAGAETEAAVQSAFVRLAGRVRAFSPDVVVQFSPDHFNGFFYDLMPSFCVGAAAAAIGDWGTQAGPLDVPEDFARALAAGVQAQDIDLAISYRMLVDHGVTQIWEEMFGSVQAFPIVPIFVNAIATPLPSYRRARMLGEAVGRYVAGTGLKVLFAASGGLSHDPPIPALATAPDDVRARLIDGRDPDAAMRAAREERVRAAGRAAASGLGAQIALNPEWDRAVLALFETGDIGAFDGFDTDDVARTAGRAANETLAWVAAFAAQSVAGPIDSRVEFYEAIPSWIAGMAMMFGETAGVPA